MFIILGEPILAGEQSRYSGMQFTDSISHKYTYSRDLVDTSKIISIKF